MSLAASAAWPGSARALIIAAAGALLAGSRRRPCVAAVPARPRPPGRSRCRFACRLDGARDRSGASLPSSCSVSRSSQLGARRAFFRPIDRRVSRRTSPIVEAAARAGMPPPATSGLRMALQAGSGESAVPIRSAFAGAVAGIAGITAVFVFAASLAHLESTPRLYGWTFDLKTAVGTQPGVPCADRDDHGLADAPGVAAIAVACVRGVEVDGHPVSAWAIESLRGSDQSRGRRRAGAPRPERDRVGIGHPGRGQKQIGDSVTVEAEAGDHRYRIVGRVVLPTISIESLQPLADGASFTISGIRSLIVQGENETHFLLVKARPGADHRRDSNVEPEPSRAPAMQARRRRPSRSIAFSRSIGFPPSWQSC